MTIATYEVAKNFYIETPGKWHVRAVLKNGLTQLEPGRQAGFKTKRAAEKYAQELISFAQLQTTAAQAVSRD